MHHIFSIDDPPPKGKENLSKFDRYDKEKDHNIRIKDLKEALKQHSLSADGSIHDTRKRCKNYKPPISTKKKYYKKVIGYAGMMIRLM